MDGCRLSRAEVVVVPHRNPEMLREVLERPGFRRRLVVTEGLFSMEGHSAPLKEIVEVAREAEALVVVDDAHGNGVLGASGRGALEEAGVASAPDILEVGTFGKAFGGYGAFVAWTPEGIDYLVHRARGFVFSTALPPGVAAVDREGLRIAAAEPERRERVRALGRRLRAALAGRSLVVRPGDAPVVPVMLGDPATAVRVSDRLLERGFWVPSIRPPTVPEGTSRLRVSVSAAHREEEVDALAEALVEAVRV